jgi:hypothetical protein
LIEAEFEYVCDFEREPRFSEGENRKLRPEAEAYYLRLYSAKVEMSPAGFSLFLSWYRMH